MSKRLPIFERGLAAVLLLLASGSFAQSPPAPALAEGQPEFLERGAVRLRYGVALRQGGQLDAGPGVTYSGLTQNDVAVGAAWYPWRAFGLWGGLQREAFTLLRAADPVTGGALVRASVGPAARILLGPVKLEAHAGYQFAQLPAFVSTVDPALAPLARHGLLLASRASLALPLGIIAEARGEFPLALGLADPAGGNGRAFGFAAGGGISFPFYSTRGSDWRVGLDYQYVQDEVSLQGNVRSAQQLSRVGAAIQLDFLDPRTRTPRTGGLRVVVVADEDGAPLKEASLVLEGPGRTSGSHALAADGSAQLEALAPGPIVARVTAAGRVPQQATAQIRAGDSETVELRLKKEAPKVGALQIKVVDKQSGAAIEGARVKFKDAAHASDAAGTVSVPDLAPGLLSVAVEAEGYQKAEEAVTIVAGRTSELPVTLLKVAQKAPATISGLVRSTRGGKPVRARLVIPELSLEVQADEQGSFRVTVPAGAFRVIISAPGFRQQTKQVTVREGDQTIFNVDLHPRSR